MEVKFYTIDSDHLPEMYIPIRRGVVRPEKYIYFFICQYGELELVMFSGEKFLLKKYNCVFIGPGNDFRITRMSEDFFGCCTTAETSWARRIEDLSLKVALNKLLYRPRLLTLTEVEHNIAQAVVHHLRDLQLRPGSDSDPYLLHLMMGYLKTFIFAAVQIQAVQNTQEKKMGTRRENQISDDFIKLVEANYKTQRKVSFYAEKLGITPKHLSSTIFQATGRHASDWIEDFTLYEIKTRLAADNSPIKEMSYELGFSSPAHLSKFFHDKTGQTPKEFRHAVKSQIEGL